MSYVGADMTQMAQDLRLSYSSDGVQLDPVALTVVGRDPLGPVWLNQDIGSGKNWVRASQGARSESGAAPVKPAGGSCRL